MLFWDVRAIPARDRGAGGGLPHPERNNVRTAAMLTAAYAAFTLHFRRIACPASTLSVCRSAFRTSHCAFVSLPMPYRSLPIPYRFRTCISYNVYAGPYRPYRSSPPRVPLLLVVVLFLDPRFVSASGTCENQKSVRFCTLKSIPSNSELLRPENEQLAPAQFLQKGACEHPDPCRISLSRKRASLPRHWRSRAQSSHPDRRRSRSPDCTRSVRRDGR